MQRNIKLKSAPNLKQQVPDVAAVRIIAGAQAWEFAKAPQAARSAEEMELAGVLPAEEPVPPIVLDNRILAEVHLYRIAPLNVLSITIQRANRGQPLSGGVMAQLCANLAAQTEAKQICLIDEAEQPLEDLSGYVERIRRGEVAVEIPEIALTPTEQSEFAERFSHLSPYERLQEFTEWWGKPMSYQKQLEAVYQYTGKKWEIIEPDDFGYYVRQYMVSHGFTKFSASKIDQIISLCKYAYEPLRTSNPDLLGFNNGILNKRTGEFMPHAKKHFLTSFINIDYYATTTPTPNFDKWLNWVSDGDVQKRQRILAALYVILTNRYEWHYFFEVTGAGGTGKSVFSHLAQILAGGEANTASMSLKDLENPVMRCALLNKTLCCSPDQESYIGDGGSLRAMSGGDAVPFNPKYIKPFNAQVRAIFLVTGNSSITFTEKKGGTSRRRVIYQFNKVVNKSEIGYQLKEKLEQEAGGIVRLLLDTFPEPRKVIELLEEQRESKEALAVKEENDHILQFAKHFEAREVINGLTLGGSKREGAHRTALHSAYLYYCDRMGITTPLNRNRFRQAFEYSLKERGSKNQLKTRLKDGINVTNIYYIDITNTLRDWDN